MSDLSPRQRYDHQVAQAELFLQQTSRLQPWLFAARGFSLLVTVIFLVLALTTAHPIAVWGFGPVAVIFVFIAMRHENLEQQRRLAKLKQRLAQRSLAVLDRRWNDLPVVNLEIPESQRPLARDLDLFGRASLFQLLDFTRTPMGTATLRDWLLQPATPDEIAARQAAVKVLGTQPDYGLELRIRAEWMSTARHDHRGASALVAWAESEGGVGRFRALPITAAVSALLMIGVVIGLGVGVIDKTIGGSIVAGLVAFDFLFTLVFAARVHDLFNAVAAKQSEAQAYRRLIEWAGNLPQGAPRLQALSQSLTTGSPPALDAISRLGLIMSAANLRRSGLLGLFYFVLQFTLLWDFHWLWILELWRRQHGSRVRGWFETVGEIEALCSLGKLAHDEPTWPYPTFITNSEAETIIQATGLGHPLLGAKRVCNRVSIGPVGTVLLVTGSNMSGKSTLLRALGANVVLAQAGAPVCAQSLSLPPLVLETSMRVHDSLAEGVSFYMAELKRLERVVAHARERSATTGPRVLFLLDEILQGTNSRERHIAVTRVVAHLIACGAIGAISSHDLELATAPDLVDKAECVHFRESFETSVGPDGQKVDRMIFDYQMRPGVATTTNALELLRMVGLGDRPADHSDGQHSTRSLPRA